MSNFNFNNICFIDLENGNDETGEPNSLDLKFQSIDGAYAAIEQLDIRKTDCITPFTFALSPGLYALFNDLYEAISIESFNGVDGVVPLVFIPEVEQAWNGVIMSDIDVSFIQSPDKDFRSPINIVGASRMTSSVFGELINIIDFEDNYKKSPLVYYKNIKEHKRLGKEYGTKMIEQYKKINTNQVNPEQIKALLLLNGAQFETTAKFAINAIAFTTVGTSFVAYIDSRLAESTIVPASITGEKILNIIVSVLRTCLYVGASDNDPSPFAGSVDAIWGLIETLLPEEQQRLDSEITNIILSNVNINYTTPNNLFIEEIPSLSQRFKGHVEYKSKFSNMVFRCNSIADEVSLSVIEAVRAAQATVDARMGNGQRPRVALLDSSIVSESTNVQITNFNDYMSDNTNIAGILLPDDNNVTQTFPIIRNTEKEGASINRGSRFLRYRQINQNYTHNRLDGEFFFVDASNNDINIIIPESTSESDSLLWKGRIFEYKRTDCSHHKVIIINKRGKFDKHSHRLLLKSKCNEQCGCDCSCNDNNSKYNDKLAYISFILREDGNAFIRC